MKSTLLRTFFEWALITSVLMSVGFFAWYLVKSRQARACQGKIAQSQMDLQYSRNVMNILAAECQAYAKTNADMQRLLAPPPSAAAPAAAPAPAPSAPKKGAK